MKVLNYLLVACFVISAFGVQAQVRTCGVKQHMQEKMQDPEFRAKYQQRQVKFEQRLQRLERNATAFRQTIEIPVAVHFPDGNEANRVCLEDLAQGQVDILNEDFRGLNPDISLWDTAKSFYPGINTGVVDVLFTIATVNHPANTDDDLVEGGKAVTIGYNFGNGGDSDTKWAGYMNFVVKDIGGGLLGYSTLGGNPNIGDTVVMNTFAFGEGSGCAGFNPGAPYNLGRTVTHELGHHYNLDHTWGNGGCSSSDFVDDTPQINDSSGGCPADGSVTMCGNTSLTMNFMDYVNDACMYMFTEGQANRVTAYLMTIKDDYKQNVLSVRNFESFGFAVYPNPTSDKVTVTFQTPSRAANIRLFDIEGRLAKESSVVNTGSSQDVSVSGLAAGVYILQVQTTRATATKKIVIR